MSYIELGRLALTIAAPLTVLTMLAALTALVFRDGGFVTLARRGFYVTAACLTLSFGCLVAGFFSGFYDARFIYQSSEPSTYWFYKLAGAWSGQTGSMLFWTWILAIYGAGMVFVLRRYRSVKLPWALVVFAAIQLTFVLATSQLEQNPFDTFENSELSSVLANQGNNDVEKVSEAGGAYTGADAQAFFEARGLWAQIPGELRQSLATLAERPIDTQALFNAEAMEPVVVRAHQAGISILKTGQGLNPLLSNYWIAIHPPALYIGYIGFTIPFCFAIAALLCGDLGSDWIRITRAFTIFAWFFLTLGNVLGGQWAYEELGWGGFWMWDPVENASFLPWLTATAFLHSVMIQERRGMLRIWNVFLIVLTYALTLVGTWITRSGMISSVHSFAGGTEIGKVLLIFIGVLFFAGLYLAAFRWPDLKSERRIGSVLSREASFLLNNLILVVLTAIVLVLTLIPLITEKFYPPKIDTQGVFFIAAPFFLALILLMGICPLIGWRKASAKNLRRNFLAPVIVFGLVTIVAFVLQFALTSVDWSPLSARFADAAPLGEKLGDLVELVLDPLIAPLMFGACAFVLATIVYEFVVGARTRMRVTRAQIAAYDERAAKNPEAVAGMSRPISEGRLAALLGLIGANRRRYGGYIIHVGIALIAVGIVADNSYKVVASGVRPGFGDSFSLRSEFPYPEDYHFTLIRFERGLRVKPDRELYGPFITEQLTADETVQILPNGEVPLAYQQVDPTAPSGTKTIVFKGNDRYFMADLTRNSTGQMSHRVNVLDPEIARHYTFQYWRSWLALHRGEQPDGVVVGLDDTSVLIVWQVERTAGDDGAPRVRALPTGTFTRYERGALGAWGSKVALGDGVFGMGAVTPRTLDTIAAPPDELRFERPEAVFAPGLRRYKGREDMMTSETDIQRTILNDRYVILREPPSQDPRTGRLTVPVAVHLNPLIVWIWVGVGILILGTAIVMFPGAAPRRGLAA